MNAKRKRDIDATRERLTTLGLVHAAEQLEPLLIVDELGFEPMTRDEASLFFGLVSYRYGRGSIRSPPTSRSATGRNSSPVTRRSPPPSSDRLLHKAHVLNIKGRSYRLIDHEATLGNQRP